MSTRLSTLTLMLAASTVFSCSRRTPEPERPVVAQPTAAQTEAPRSDDGAGQGLLDPKDPKHGTRKLMGLDTPVYVDGVQAAVLRAGELPALTAIELEGGARRYRLFDYLQAIGVSPASLRSVHLHGNGDRVASVEGKELLKERDRFVFGFTSNTTGAPLQLWDTEGLKNEFVANEIRRVTIYVTKPSPAVHPQRRCHLDDKGECTDAIPYQAGDVAKGTRIYVDGKMVGFVKRRLIGDAVAMGETASGERRFSVDRLVAQMSAGAIAGVELLAGDDVIARATGAEWQKLAADVAFTLPKHSHGKVRVRVPAALQAKDGVAADKDAMVSAIMVYRSTKPASRELTAISEQTDLSVQLAAMDDARERLGRGER